MANDRPNIRQHITPFLTQKTPFQTPKNPFLTIRNPIKMKMHQPWMITKSNKAQELKDLSTMLCPAKKMSNSIDITMQEREGKVKNVCKSFLVTLQYLLSEQEWQIFFIYDIKKKISGSNLCLSYFITTVNTPPRLSEISEKNWSTQAKPFLTFHL